MEWKLMLENRENVRVARLFGEDTAKFLKDSMKSLSEQLFSLPKIIEKSIQESETLVDKKIQLEKKTLGKEVKNSKIKGETEIPSSMLQSTDNAEADKIFKTASNSLSEYFEQKKKEEEKRKKEENKLKEIKNTTKQWQKKEENKA